MLFEVDGNSDEGVEQEAAAISKACLEKGALAEFSASGPEEIKRFWRIHKQIPWALKRVSPHQSIEDIVVPIANIPAALHELKRIGKQFNVMVPVFGHAGDGNLHATPMKNPDQPLPEWEAMLPRLLESIYKAVARLGGTISGEHGIGHKRRDYLHLVMSPTGIDILRRIKKALDPNLILNPGKIV